MSNPITLLKQSITDLGTAVGNMNRENAEQNNTLRPGFTAIATSLEGLKTRVMNLIASVRRLGQYIEDLKAQQGTNISDIGTNVEDANELKRQIAQLRQDYNTLREELLNSQQQNATLQSNLNTTSQNLQQCNIDKAQLEKQITAMQAEIDRLNNLLKSDTQEIQQLKAQVQRLNSEIQQRDQEIQRLNNVVIPGLQKDIADLKATIGPLQKEILDLKASIGPLQQQITKCNNDLEEANRNIAALQAQNQDLTDQITTSTAAITKIIATINNSRFQLDPNLTQGITTQRDELAAQIGRLEAIVNSLLPGPGPSSSSSSSVKGFSPKAAASIGSELSSSARPLPSGWESVVDSNTGRTYYFNTTTRETQWDFPEETISSSGKITPSSRGSSFSSGENIPGNREDLMSTTTTTAGIARRSGFDPSDPSTGNSDRSVASVNIPKRSIRRKNPGSISSNASDIFDIPILNAYGDPVNSPALSKEPSVKSSSNPVSSIDGKTVVKIGSVSISINNLKLALLNKSKTVGAMNNIYLKAWRSLTYLDSVSAVQKIMSDNKINVASNGAGGITLSPMSGGGRKSKKTKKKRRVRKQKGGFEYSGKSKRRRFSVTRSPSSSKSRSSSQRSSYETQSSVPPKYRARGSKKSKM